MFFYVMALVIILLDQLTKWLVVRFMDLGESIPLVSDVLFFTSHRNAGAAFGILQGQRLFFLIITIIIVLGIVYYLYKIKNDKRLLAWSLVLILGGAIGNFIDRAIRGEVVDFIDVHIRLGSFYYNFPIFNVADSALVIGAALLFIDVIRDGIKESKAKRGTTDV